MQQATARLPLISAAISGVGWTLSVFIPVILLPEDSRGGQLHFAVTGVILGVYEWQILRRRVPVSAGWIFGYGCVWFVSWRLAFEYGGIFGPDPVVLGGSGGPVVGVLQWPVLRRDLRHAWLWIPASTTSALLGCCLGYVAGFNVDQNVSSDWAYPAGAMVAGLVMGLMRGFTLKVLPTGNEAHRRHPRASPLFRE